MMSPAANGSGYQISLHLIMKLIRYSMMSLSYTLLSDEALNFDFRQLIPNLGWLVKSRNPMA